MRRLQGESTDAALPDARLLDLPWGYDFFHAPELTAFYSVGLVSLLKDLAATLLITSMPAGKLILVRAAQDRLSLQVRTFDKISGIAVDRRRLAVATAGTQIWLLENEPALATAIAPAGRYDSCYVCRSSHVTGTIGSHEIAWADDGLWIVNTRFSCLCTLDAHYSFVPRWQPPFVSELLPEDRCHLNGLAVVDGKPRFVTCFSRTDSTSGWRRHSIGGGCLVDVIGSRVVADGLTMPHSPRVRDGQVLLLDSGTGRLVAIDPANGRVEPVAEFDAFLRGLALSGSLAFVALSKIRRLQTTLPLEGALADQEGRCGFRVIDVTSGRTVAFLEFIAGIDEIFDVQILHGARYPTVIGPATWTGTHSIAESYVLPGGRVIIMRDGGDQPSNRSDRRDPRVGRA
jgi:uncharacterized protein (TIGR03032 family)